MPSLPTTNLRDTTYKHQCKIASSGIPRRSAAPTIGAFSPNTANLNSSMPHFRIALTFSCSMGKRNELLSAMAPRSEEHTSELQSHLNLVCRLLLEKKKKND